MILSRMRSKPLFACGLVALTVGACLGSGQTGSPSCPAPTSCICDPLYAGGVLLRVHGQSFESGKLEAVVDEALSPSDRALDLQIGDRVGGSLLVEKPCAPGESSASLSSAELFVLFHPGNNGRYPGCSAFQACAATDCTDLPEPELTECWSACVVSTLPSDQVGSSLSLEHFDVVDDATPHLQAQPRFFAARSVPWRGS